MGDFKSFKCPGDQVTDGSLYKAVPCMVTSDGNGAEFNLPTQWPACRDPAICTGSRGIPLFFMYLNTNCKNLNKYKRSYYQYQFLIINYYLTNKCTIKTFYIKNSINIINIFS